MLNLIKSLFQKKEVKQIDVPYMPYDFHGSSALDYSRERYRFNPDTKEIKSIPTGEFIAKGEQNPDGSVSIKY